jgi:hypothetical protein
MNNPGTDPGSDTAPVPAPVARLDIVLTLEHFAPLVGRTLQVVKEGYLPYPVTLISAKPLGRRATAIPMTRPPFDLRFSGPGPGYLPQDLWTVEHPELGLIPVFLVPLGPTEGGFLYQALFN